jgi:hypothetical protein
MLLRILKGESPIELLTHVCAFSYPSRQRGRGAGNQG